VSEFGVFVGIRRGTADTMAVSAGHRADSFAKRRIQRGLTNLRQRGSF
jgi:hypothetical protein